MIRIFTDGASRGNPGPAASACIFVNDQDEMTISHAEYIGITTNNVAEYTAILKALNMAEGMDTKLHICSDSELVIRQITGKYRIHKPHLKTLYEEVRRYDEKFTLVTWENLPRTNPYIKTCDTLCNKELDLHSMKR